MAERRLRLAGWGNVDPVDCRVAAPATRSALRAAIAGPGRCIARGLGRSYGDSAVLGDGTVVEQRFCDRILGFDPIDGVVDCEAGVSLADLIAVYLPRGFFLPTTPGTKFVTVGGAIAADVHGKNHHADGTFGTHVVDLDLLVADGSVVTCAPDRDGDLFWATVGGMGLTGVILRARIRLLPVRTAWFRTRTERHGDLGSVLARLADPQAQARYSVGWIDCLATGASLGRTVLMLGDHAGVEDLPHRERRRPLVPKARRARSVPVDFPGWALNRWSVAAFNQCYWWSQGPGGRLVDYDRWFYPLDAMHGWNRIYGKRGFVQYQALFADAQAEAGLRRLLERIAAAGAASFLAVIKRCGPANPSPLSFLHEGVTLALDLPNTGAALRDLVRDLDRIVLDHGGRLYLAKDTLMDAATFAAMYPRRDDFLRVKARVDPAGRFVSDQARRVGLCP